MHDLEIRVQPWLGDSAAEYGDEGSVLLVSVGDLYVNGEPVRWHTAVGSENGSEPVPQPTLEVGDGFVSLTIHHPTWGTRFPPAVHLEGTTESLLILPIRTVSVVEK